MIPTLQAGQTGRAGARAVAAAGWNAGLADALWSFSTLGRVAAAGLGLMSQYSIVSTRSNSAGKWYAEVRFEFAVGYGSSVRHDVGLTRDNPPAGASSPITAGHGYRRNGNIYVNASSTVSAAGLSSGDIVRIAADLTMGDAWYAVNGGAWIGGGDPEGSPSAPTLTGLTTGVPWFVGACKETGVETTTFTLYGHAALLNYAVPAGFTPWAD